MRKGHEEMDITKATELLKAVGDSIDKMEQAKIRLERALNAIDYLANGSTYRVKIAMPGESNYYHMDITSLLPDMTDHITKQLEQIVEDEYKVLDQWGFIDPEKERAEADRLLKAEPSIDDLLEGLGQKNFIPDKVEEREPVPEFVPYKPKKAAPGTKSVPVDEALLKVLYEDQGKTVSQICKEQNWNSSSVYNAIKRIGLKRSGRSAC